MSGWNQRSNKVKHEYLRSRAYICLSLSLTSSSSVISQLWPLSRYSCFHLGSLHPRNFCFETASSKRMKLSKWKYLSLQKYDNWFEVRCGGEKKIQNIMMTLFVLQMASVYSSPMFPQFNSTQVYISLPYQKHGSWQQ